MSMTREEAVEALQKFVDGYEKIIDEERVKENGFVQAIKVALAALHPVSREQVERMWRGEWVPVGDSTFYNKCSKCGKITVGKRLFCSSCGAPMTDEAVQMVMERLEALHERNDD